MPRPLILSKEYYYEKSRSKEIFSWFLAVRGSRYVYMGNRKYMYTREGKVLLRIPRNVQVARSLVA